MLKKSSAVIVISLKFHVLNLLFLSGIFAEYKLPSVPYILQSPLSLVLYLNAKLKYKTSLVPQISTTFPLESSSHVSLPSVISKFPLLLYDLLLNHTAA